MKLQKYVHEYELEPSLALPDDRPPVITLEFDQDGQHCHETYSDGDEAFNRAIALFRRQVKPEITTTRVWKNQKQVMVLHRRGSR